MYGEYMNSPSCFDLFLLYKSVIIYLLYQRIWQTDMPDFGLDKGFGELEKFFKKINYNC